MFGRRKPVEPPLWGQEHSVREELYGAENRSGEVTRYGPIKGVVLITHDAVNPGLFRVVEPWMKWDTIRWDWPVYGEINHTRYAQDF